MERHSGWFVKQSEGRDWHRGWRSSKGHSTGALDAGQGLQRAPGAPGGQVRLHGGDWRFTYLFIKRVSEASIMFPALRTQQ